MIPTVLGGWALMRARKMVESSSSNNMWKEGELRAVVVLSLVLQIVLICLGKRRKYTAGHWIRGVTWSAYLLADTVAIYALGLISSMIGEMHWDNLAGNMDPHAELSVFWAPFLLLHLGGPDMITANALEDNELWLRHLLALINQTGITFYILVMSWRWTSVTTISFLMMFSGVVKYGERVWALNAASNNQFKKSITSSRPQLFNKIVETYQLKKAEGFDVIPHEVIEVREVQIPKDVVTDCTSNLWDSSLSPEQLYKRSQGALVAANSLVKTFQRLFADLLFSSEDRDTSLSLMKDKHSHVVFRIIEMELAFIYDLFYTKAKVIYSRSGFISRLIILFFICVVLVLFSLSDKQKYSRMDLGVTFLLLGGAIFLEIYALCDILFSDRVACWLIDHKSLKILNFLNGVRRLSERHRWSNSIGQCSLVSFSLKEENLPCRRFLNLLSFDEQVAKYLYVEDHAKMSQALKDFIVSQLQSTVKRAPELPSVWTERGGRLLGDNKAFNHLKWSVELEFDMSILVWHIATELCFHLPARARNFKEEIRIIDRKENGHIQIDMGMSKHLSRYMLFLLVCYPSMLPMGMGSIRFQDVSEEASKFFKQNRGTNGECMAKCLRCFGRSWCCWKSRGRRLTVTDACDILRTHVKTKFNLSVTKEDKAKYVLFQGCRLAAEIEALGSEEIKGLVLREVWVEMLFYAANKCKGRTHAQQMVRGGELLTHVWLLMAHFGFTEHFQIPHAPAVAELVVK